MATTQRSRSQVSSAKLARRSPSKGNPTAPTFTKSVGSTFRTNGTWECPTQRTLGGSLPIISLAFASVVAGKKPSLLDLAEPCAMVIESLSGPIKVVAIGNCLIDSTKSPVNSAVQRAGNQL